MAVLALLGLGAHLNRVGLINGSSAMAA